MTLRTAASTRADGRRHPVGLLGQGSAGSFYLKPPTGNLGTRTAIRTTVRPQLAHGRDSQSRPNLSYRRLEVLAKFRPLAARGSAQLLNLVQLAVTVVPYYSCMMDLLASSSTVLAANQSRNCICPVQYAVLLRSVTVSASRHTSRSTDLICIIFKYMTSQQHYLCTRTACLKARLKSEAFRAIQARYS
eukprot:COSAG01_NODE_9195_length_2523_cov_27.632990_2_plen_189_part_00